jgi:hypothetical protein
MSSETLVHTLQGMANLYGKDISDEGAELLVRVLERYPPEFVMSALERCTLELPKFPTIAEIIERMPGQHSITPDQEATLLANRIIARIGLDGYTNPHRAREKIGEIGWQAILQSYGSWEAICGLKADQLPSARAQLEKLCKAMIAQGTLPAPGAKKLIAEEKPALDGPRSFGGLLTEIAERGIK